MNGATLEAHLNSFASGGSEKERQIADAIRHLTSAALKLRGAIAESASAAVNTSSRISVNADGDHQHEIDLHADELFFQAARAAEVASYASEERVNPIAINPASGIALAVDPLDGSSNIHNNLSIGSIFSIVPSTGDAEADFLQQLAAGFFIYGPQLCLALTLRQGTYIFAFSQRIGTFVETRAALAMPVDTTTFSINTSNYRHWDEAVRLYVDDCLQGAEGVRGKDFNMRWNACLIAEAFRILLHGGAFLYPRDRRQGYGSGRLRLVYEGNPIAMLIEQAGGTAIDAAAPILDLQPSSLHQRVPLIFGSKHEVGAIARYHVDPCSISARHPLFANRGLFRA